MKYCPNCGKKIKNGVVFCPYCGTKQLNLRASNQSPLKVHKNYKKHHKWLYATIILLIFLVGGCGYGYHKWKQTPQSINLSTTIPGHYWKISGGGGAPLYNEHFTKHYEMYKGHIRGNIIWHKNSFKETHGSNDYSIYKLEHVRNHKYYVIMIKSHSPSYNYYRNVITGNGNPTCIRHGNKVTIKKGSHQITVFLKKMLDSKDSEIQGLGDALAHKPLIFTKE